MLRLNLIRMVLFVGVYSVLVPAAFAQHEHPAGDPTKLGKVSFPAWGEMGASDRHPIGLAPRKFLDGLHPRSGPIRSAPDF
jgi:hypothetical protein